MRSRVLEAGKATIYTTLSASENITHVLTNDTTLKQQRKVSGVPCYPVCYLGGYLLESEITSYAEKWPVNYLKAEQEAKVTMTGIQIDEMRNALIKHIYLQKAMLSKYTHVDQMNECRKEEKNVCSRGIDNVLEELVDNHLFPIAITEFLCGKDLIPPVKFLHSLLEHILQGNADPTLSVQFFHFMYTLLQHDPPWKSPPMLKYYLEVLQCPACMMGTWSLVEMLVRSCLYYSNICHSVCDSGAIKEDRMFHKKLLTFILNLFQAEVLALTKSLYDEAIPLSLQVMPPTVLLKTFWLGSDSVLSTKQIQSLVHWVINSYRRKYKTNDIFEHEVAELLNGILGAVVEYWIISGFIMDRNVLHSVADDLATCITISCDDFSTEELKMFVSSIPSLWLEMFVAEAVFKKISFQSNTITSPELISLKKIVCSYLPALEVEMHEAGRIQRAKKKKIGQWPCPESQRALLMLNGDKQNQAGALPDVPVQTTINCLHVPKKVRNQAKVEMSHSKENCHSSAKQINVLKVNVKGETALHIACRRNNVKRLIHLLSLPEIDINIKDYAGWTPLHEACNHGSTVCVREILQHCPEVDLLSEVNGVTPLHDALLNGHVEIAKLLLQNGGPVLLQQMDSEGKFPLDYLECVTTKQDLLHSIRPEERVEDFHAQVKNNMCDQQVEFGAMLFCKMLLNFCSVYNLFIPFSLTSKKLTTNPLLETTSCFKLNTSFYAHWFIDLYFRELETFQNLPVYLQKTIEELKKCPGEQKEAFSATLQQIAVTIQLSNLDLTSKLPR
ncbi:SMC5-SMC6 complex localization factor protein 1 isoform X2 [Eublepharis macularius]|uniref:SMC5-SMC6 complex localization factor protein 1 isoform X2 n=1 Tax=Eublepharis macularius TaxID=481883 RepID=A0AA97JS70_EUBMA|nr:SMC5-SMC6 complex localization factor protein 1 isoform X2 [Eublepharis macularius]XP_054843241.1 SMC5-SMC6 complex localization factor protein 1 isoform X2 [Eublepharis macularius]